VGALCGCGCEDGVLDRDVGVGFCLAGRERGSGCCVMNLRLLGGGMMC